MSRRKPIYPQADLNAKVISGDVDLFFEKSGKALAMINSDPNIWWLAPQTTNVLQCSGTEMHIAQVTEMQPRFIIGETYMWSDNLYIDIVDAKLIRLANVTEQDAISSGVEKINGNGYKHYCPQKLFPPAVLKKQLPGHPYMQNAQASFFTRWVDKYGVLDVALNPWIWRYEFKFNINHLLTSR